MGWPRDETRRVECLRANVSEKETWARWECRREDHNTKKQSLQDVMSSPKSLPNLCETITC